MAAATIMSLLFTPVFYVVMQRLSEFRKKPALSGGTSPAGTSETAGG
jgi:hypothetical protein